jgi:hypothetical protein
MKITRRVLVSVIYLALTIGVLFAPDAAISVATTASAVAAPTTWTVPLRGGPGGDGGPGGQGSNGGGGFGGQRLGDPNAYSGGRGHMLWPYSPGVLDVPHVDTTVHRSRQPRPRQRPVIWVIRRRQLCVGG